ncbi:hypothetical protein KY342_06835 [Candidatus Woesearchaeota archaeon]|nr:hypothetical protein [Candidatus Woesearchaeota archaeon]
MKYKNIFGMEIEWDFKKIFLLSSLLIFPNVLALFHFQLFGLRIHFFQYLIFLAAFIFGPVGGILSGGIGSFYTAIALNNPYIAIGNMILGGFVGLFMKYKIGIMPSVLLAYAIQVPWLWVTDIYLAGMIMKYVNMIVIALLVSNIICGFMTKLTAKRIKSLFFDF